MLQLISYLILNEVEFFYYPSKSKFDEPSALRFYGRDRAYVIHEFANCIDPYQRYYLMEYDGGKPIASNITAIELLDVVATII